MRSLSRWKHDPDFPRFVKRRLLSSLLEAYLRGETHRPARRPEPGPTPPKARKGKREPDLSMSGRVVGW